jgi:hypothetical protein
MPNRWYKHLAQPVSHPIHDAQQDNRDKKFRRGFEDGRTHHQSQPAVEQASTVSVIYDPAVKIAMVQNTASTAEPAAIRSFTGGSFRH